MNDAYNVQSCHAIAGEITTLAATRLDPGVNHLSSRILPEPLAVFPVMAATGTDDAQWSSIVAWTVHTLVSAERPETRWYAGGAGAMPIAAPELGLDKEWQRRVLTAVGNYGDIFERQSRQRLPAQTRPRPQRKPVQRRTAPESVPRVTAIDVSVFLVCHFLDFFLLR